MTSLLPQFQADAIEALRVVFAAGADLDAAAGQLGAADEVTSGLVSAMAPSWPGSALELVEEVFSLPPTRRGVVAAELKTWTYTPSMLLTAASRAHRDVA